MSFRFRLPIVAGLAVVLLLGISQPAAVARADFGDQAKGFIESLAGKAIDALADAEATDEQRTERFNELLKGYFAVDAIGRFVLGQYWRRASEDERAEYLTLFEDFIITTYSDRFADYSGEQLTVTQAVTLKEDDALVKSEIARADTSQQPIRVDWRVRTLEGEIRIVDVVVEGVSMSQTQRSEFASVIRRNGDDVGALITMLRERTAAR